MCYSHDITNFPSLSYTFSFSIPFLSFHSFILSFYCILYNLYLNPNLLKILSNYTYTIPKVTTLHTYILTSCLIFFTHFLPFLTPFSILLHTFLSPLFFLYAFPSYFLTFPTHCLAVPQLILLYLVIYTTILTVNITSCQVTVPYCAILYMVINNSIGSSFKLLCNSALLCHYCASIILQHSMIFRLIFHPKFLCSVMFYCA